MSYCALHSFDKDGNHLDTYEFKNSWGGAAFIWDALFNKFLKDPKNEYDCWMIPEENTKKLWKLWEDPRLDKFMAAVLLATFDRATVAKENFKEYAQDLRAFVDYFGTRDRVCHLNEWAKCIESLPAEAEFIGFYLTSVSDDLWFKYNEEEDKIITYDFKNEKKHFDVYESLKEPVIKE